MPRKKVEKSEREPLKNYVSCRFTDTQLKSIKEKADKVADGDISKMIRLLCSKNNVVITSKVDIETRNQIRKIGVNINQVVHKINIVDNTNELKYELIILNKLIDDLKNVLKKIT